MNETPDEPGAPDADKLGLRRPTAAQTRRAVAEFARRNDLVMDEEDAVKQLIRADRLRQMQFHFRWLRLLAQYQGNRDMAIDCLVLAHGQGDMIGMHTAVEVAVKHFADPKKKAAVTKCIKLFQDCLGVEGMPGQRTEKARKAMEAARKKQLKKKK